MKDKLSKEQTDTILKALDDAIERGPWEGSNFLRAIGKKLTGIRDRFIEHLNIPEPEHAKKATQLANQLAMRSGKQLIYVALYSYDGANLQSWERILINLPKQSISRPIYASEEDVKSIIKTKENKNNEAYLSLYINASDILSLSPERTPIDKLGKPLLSLKDNSITVENYNLFMHVSGTYKYHQGRLDKQPLDDNNG